MGKKITYYLTVGFKISLVNLFSNAILLIPSLILMGGSIDKVLTGGNQPNLWLVPLLIPIALSLNGFLVNKYKNWIFR